VNDSSRIEICALNDLDEVDARGFDYETPEGPRSGFVIRRGDAVYAYRNVCPHAGHPLNWKPDAFLTRDRTRIMCSVHGAIFEPETGLCIGGPCPGRSLTPLRAEVHADRLIVVIDV